MASVNEFIAQLLAKVSVDDSELTGLPASADKSFQKTAAAADSAGKKMTGTIKASTKEVADSFAKLPDAAKKAAQDMAKVQFKQPFDNLLPVSQAKILAAVQANVGAAEVGAKQVSSAWQLGLGVLRQVHPEIAGIGEAATAGFGAAASGAALAGVAIAAVGITAIKMSMDFNKSMSDFVGAMPGPIERVEALGATIRRLSADTGDSMDAVKKVAGVVSEAFAGTDQIQEKTRQLQLLGQAFNDPAKFAEMASRAVKLFNDTSPAGIQHMGDLIAKTKELTGVVDTDKFVKAFEPLLVPAHELGLTARQLDEVAAGLVKISRAEGSIAAGSAAVLKFLEALQKPTPQMKLIFKAEGVDDGQALIQKYGSISRTARELLDDVAKNAPRIKLQDLVGDVDTAHAVQQLASLGKEYKLVTTNLNGSAKEIAGQRQQMDEMGKAVARLKQNIESSLIGLGGIITNFVGRLEIIGEAAVKFLKPLGDWLDKIVNLGNAPLGQKGLIERIANEFGYKSPPTGMFGTLTPGAGAVPGGYQNSPAYSTDLGAKFIKAATDGIRTPAGQASCAYFASQALQQMGAAVPKIGGAKALQDYVIKMGATAKSALEAQVGDLLVFHGKKYGAGGSGYHVAIAAGGGMMRQSSGGVVTTQRISDYAHATAYSVPQGGVHAFTPEEEARRESALNALLERKTQLLKDQGRITEANRLTYGKEVGDKITAVDKEIAALQHKKAGYKEAAEIEGIYLRKHTEMMARASGHAEAEAKNALAVELHAKSYAKASPLIKAHVDQLYRDQQAIQSHTLATEEAKRISSAFASGMRSVREELAKVTASSYEDQAAIQATGKAFGDLTKQENRDKAHALADEMRNLFHAQTLEKARQGMEQVGAELYRLANNGRDSLETFAQGSGYLDQMHKHFADLPPDIQEVVKDLYQMSQALKGVQYFKVFTDAAFEADKQLKMLAATSLEARDALALTTPDFPQGPIGPFQPGKSPEDTADKQRQASAGQELEQLQAHLKALSAGTSEGALAWEKYHVSLDQLSPALQQIVHDISEAQKNTAVTEAANNSLKALNMLVAVDEKHRLAIELTGVEYEKLAEAMRKSIDNVDLWTRQAEHIKLVQEGAQDLASTVGKAWVDMATGADGFFHSFRQGLSQMLAQALQQLITSQFYQMVTGKQMGGGGGWLGELLGIGLHAAAGGIGHGGTPDFNPNTGIYAGKAVPDEFFHRAEGGPIEKYKQYMVAEPGTGGELIMPNFDGQAIPLKKLGGTTNVVNHYHVHFNGIQNLDRRSARQMSSDAGREMSRQAARDGHI